MRVSVRLLGTPAFLVGSVRVGPESAILFAALLRITLDANLAVERDDLASSLWPKAKRQSARRHSLRQLLYRLRQIGLPFDGSGSSVGIDPSSVQVDTNLLLSKGLVSAPIDALQRLGEGVLSGYEPRWSRRMSDWVDSLRDSEHAAIRRSLNEALVSLETLPHWGRVEATATALRRLDPLNRNALAALVAVHEQRGERTQAALHLAELTLDGSTGGIGANDANTEARRLVRRWTRGNGTDQQAGGEISIQGREREIAALRDLLRRSLTTSGGVCYIVGTGGVGKSRLLQEALGIATRLGIRSVVRAVEPSAFLQPLSLWSSVAKLALQLPGALGASAEALATCREAIGAGCVADSTKVAVAIGEVLSAAADERPVLVAIDDAEKGGDSLWPALMHMASSVRQSRVVLAVAGRALSTNLDDASNSTILRLSSLSDDDAGALVRALAAQRRIDISEQTLDRYVAISGGLPLFVEELVRLLAEDSTTGAVSRTLEDTIRRRTMLLSDDAQALLPFVAALDSHATSERLLRLTGWPALRLVHALDVLERHQLLVANQSQPRVRHGMISETVLGALSSSARSALHRSVVDVLLSESGADTTPATVVACAHHLLMCGAKQDAIAMVANVVRSAHEDSMSDTFAALLEVVKATRQLDKGREMLRSLVSLAATSAHSAHGQTAIDSLDLRPSSVATARIMMQELGATSVEVLRRTTTEWHPLVAGAMSVLSDETTIRAERLDAAAAAMVLGADLGDTALMRMVIGLIANAQLTEDDNSDAFLRANVIFHVTCGRLEDGVVFADRLVQRASTGSDKGQHSRALTYCARAHRILGEYSAASDLNYEAFRIARDGDFASRALGAAVEGVMSSLQAEQPSDVADWLSRADSVVDRSSDENFRATLDGVRTRAAILLGIGSVPATASNRPLRQHLQERQLRPRAQLLADDIIRELSHGRRAPIRALRQLRQDAAKLYSQADVDALAAAILGALAVTDDEATAAEVKHEFLALRRDRLRPPSFLDRFPASLKRPRQQPSCADQA